MTVSEVSAVLQRVLKEEQIIEERGTDLASYYAAILTDVMAARRQRCGKPIVLGICGSQGAGKSTMARVLQEALRESNELAVAVLSLDDLYLSSSERLRLAREVHPLLRTRGVPGTHNVNLGIEIIERLIRAKPKEITRLPRFDKALDEPKAAERWEKFSGRADLVIFEGWCVGAVPQMESALAQPINALECDFDPDGRWRRYVNGQLAGPYRALFDLLNRLLMVRAPGFEVVVDWRQEQERKLEARTRAAPAAATRIMNDAELRHFVMYYERITRHILAEMPARADAVVQLDARRQIIALARR